MDFQQAAEYALSLAREHREKDVDILLTRDESITIRVLGGKVEKVDQSTGQGLGVRVLRDGRTGIAYTERLEPSNIETAFLAATENSGLNDPTEVVMNTAFPDVPDPETLNLYNPDLQDLTMDQLAAFGLETEAVALKADGRVKAVPYLAVQREQSSYCVVSTHGQRYEQHSNSVGAYCGVMLEENGQRKSGSHFWNARTWQPEKAAELGSLSVEKGAALLGANPIPGGAIPVVLHEDVAPQLLGMFFGSFSAESAQKGLSRLKGRLGETIAVETITLTDEPHRDGAEGSRFMDVEGVATQTLPLIEKGVFTNLLYHIESARKEGRESTGHAGRGYSGGISTRSNNLVMNLGTHDLDGLCALPERCLLVTELEGGAGCNPISGDISIGVQGFLVESGQRGRPVDRVTIAGNFFDLLQNIGALGNQYQPRLTKTFIPALLVEGLTVSS